MLIVPTTDGEASSNIRCAWQAWKIGRKKIDDGALLVIAKNDRRLRIEVGYGLEGALTDATRKRIIDEDIAPKFKTGDFAGGVSAGRRPDGARGRRRDSCLGRSRRDTRQGFQRSSIDRSIPFSLPSALSSRRAVTGVARPAVRLGGRRFRRSSWPGSSSDRSWSALRSSACSSSSCSAMRSDALERGPRQRRRLVSGGGGIDWSSGSGSSSRRRLQWRRRRLRRRRRIGELVA